MNKQSNTIEEINNKCFKPNNYTISKLVIKKIIETK